MLVGVPQSVDDIYRRIARMDMGFGFGYLYPDAESVRLIGA